MTAVTSPDQIDWARLEDQWAPTKKPKSARFSRLARDEITILTLVALVGYLASAWWTRSGLHFWINDALNRTDDALYVSIGRDPHLGAIGFYWPPLPQLIQIPIVPFLRPFGEEVMAGPISTALCMALTLPVIAAIGRKLRRGRVLVFMVCLTFAVSPYIAYTASNGMSEACSYLTVAISMLGFIGYIESRSTRDLLILTFGLAAVAMTRPEGPAFIVIIVAVATLEFSRSRLRHSLWQATLIALPPLAVYLFWLTTQYVLLKDFLFFLHQNQAQKPPAPGTRIWLPPHVDGNLGTTLLWAAGWLLVFGPILFALPFTMLPGLRRRPRGTLGILGGMASFATVQVLSVAFQDGFGDPRYFCMAVLFGAITALWLAAPEEARPKRSLSMPPSRVWNVCLVSVLVFSGAYTSYSLTSGRLTHVENECVYFQYGVARVIPLLGRSQTGRYACRSLGDGLAAWQEADTWIDHHLSGRDRVLADNQSNYAADLFSRRPGLFIVRSDRDWEKIVANPVHVSYILTQSTTAKGAPSGASSDNPDLGAMIIGYDPAGWRLVESYGGGLNVLHLSTWVQIWRFVPHPGVPTPVGTQTALDQGR